MRSYKYLNRYYQSGNLYINDQSLQSLDGCPQHITGNFTCRHNMLSSLIGGPQRVDGTYDCSENLISDLIGCASHIAGRLICTSENLTSLVGVHKIIKTCQDIRFYTHQITQGGIGLLLIDDLTNISPDTEPFRIINSYLGTGTKGMMACSKILVAEGYEEYAKL